MIDGTTRPARVTDDPERHWHDDKAGDTPVSAGQGQATPASDPDWAQSVELLTRHRRALLNHAVRYSLCREDAEDALQRASEKLLTRAPDMGRFQAYRWMKTVVRNEALTIRRQRERMMNTPDAEERTAEKFGELDWVSLIPSESPEPDDAVEFRERVSRAHEALHKLKRDERRAMGLLGKGYSYREIQDLTGWTYTKVNRCLAEGRKRFEQLVRSSETGELCSGYETALLQLCDGDIGTGEQAEVENHLRVCGSCRAALAGFKAGPKAAAALAPTAPLAALGDKATEIAAVIQSRMPGRGGSAGEAVLAQATSGGSYRGNGMAAFAQLAVLCIGAGGSAAVCTATGITPTEPEGDKRPPAIRKAEAETAPVPADDAGSDESGFTRPEEAIAPAPPPAEAEETESHASRRSDEGPAPIARQASTVESEFTPESAGFSAVPVAGGVGSEQPPDHRSQDEAAVSSTPAGDDTGRAPAVQPAPPPPPAPTTATSGAPKSAAMPRLGGGGEFGP